MPNFFSSMLLLANGGALLGVTLAVRARSGGVSRSGGVGRSEGVGRRVVVGWAILTAFFLFMGMDDATKLHERLGSIFSWMVTDDAGDAKGHILGRLYDVYPSYTWQLVVGPIFAA